jgi:astacin
MERNDNVESDSNVTAGEMIQGDTVRKGYIKGVTFSSKLVEYTVVNGLAMFEGDIVLGPADRIEEQFKAASEMQSYLPAKGIGITGDRYRWPNGLIPYAIDPSLQYPYRVYDAIAHWESKTRIRFVQITEENASQYPNYVNFIPSTGCWSNVGMQTGRQDIGLAVGCSTGNAIHEIGHTIGLWHEQSREDRNNFVKINYRNIQVGHAHNFNQQITDGDDYGDYDYTSIMHYGAYAFSKNYKPTIEPLQPDVTIGQRDGLSEGDILAVHSMYPSES